MRRIVISLSRKVCLRSFSDSVTYSGGQATTGQGGFYGSGGSRLKTASPAHHPEAIARQADILTLSNIMSEVYLLENELDNIGTTTVNAKTIELKARISKLIQNKQVHELLSRLEIKGEPVWGLSTKERDLVRAVRAKYNRSK